MMDLRASWVPLIPSDKIEDYREHGQVGREKLNADGDGVLRGHRSFQDQGLKGFVVVYEVDEVDLGRSRRSGIRYCDALMAWTDEQSSRTDSCHAGRC
ncbi:hypothetical protein ACRALDRAFT_2031320 [Sodiomyces alcalophilus JCM 7366]|uniref:uncharacterized protein n=1 Tax=Sodiomyces alcalophilus JCM 7366 TaxID=591952 RepID=UPI0039B62BBC